MHGMLAQQGCINMTKKVTRADGVVSYVSEEFLDSVVQEGDTVEDYEAPTERLEPTAEEISNNLVAMENYEARKYLTETDWYVTRKAETGKAIPDDVLTKREEARAKVKSI